MVEIHARTGVALRDRITKLIARLSRLAAGPQWLHPSRPRLPRSRHQQEGGHRSGLSATGRQLPLVGVRSLPAESALRERSRRWQTRAAAMADDGASRGPL